jgi:hypothetical protein
MVNMKRLLKWVLLGLAAFYVSVDALYVFGKVYRILASGGLSEPLLEYRLEGLYKSHIICLAVLAVIWLFLDKAQRSFAALLVATTLISLATFAYLHQTGHFYIKDTKEVYDD